MERRMKQTQFTKREIFDIVNDTRFNPHTGGLHYPRPFSDRLVKEGKLTFASQWGGGLDYEFVDPHTLRWLFHGFEWREEYYEAYEAADNVIFFFHCIKGSSPPEMRSFCVDFNTNRVIVNNAQIGNDEYTPRDTSNRMSFAQIAGREVTGEPHEFTDDFVGKVAAWELGGGMWLTHHYINTKFFLNEIGAGPNPFLTIAEPAQYVKIDAKKQLYLFSWREMAGPGIMGWDIMDFSSMTSIGMFYGINEADRFECYCFTRSAGKWLSVEDRKLMCKEGLYAVINKK
ncbi:MAG: MoaF N-terminal domain-containing protein [Oscillospiraceae bacterium]|jgi:hypothetical protein|nr:MoaF N-terminal domain-containing protein [Oscillospiraceae bacterium]